MLILPTDLQTRGRSELSGENPVGGRPGPPPRMDPVGGGEPAEPGDPGALIGRGDCRRAGGDAAYAERAETGMGEGREGQRAENAFNNINIGGGDGDGDDQTAGFSQGRQVQLELIMGKAL